MERLGTSFTGIERVLGERFPPAVSRTITSSIQYDVQTSLELLPMREPLEGVSVVLTGRPGRASGSAAVDENYIYLIYRPLNCEGIRVLLRRRR